MPRNWTDTLAARRARRHRPNLDAIDWRAVATGAGVTKTAINRWAQARSAELDLPYPPKIEDADDAVRRQALAHFGGA